MHWPRPEPATVFEAIESYLRVAYGGTAPPRAVAERVATLRAAPPDDLFNSPVLERDDPKSPTRYALRLGNRGYPHMKLVIERSPDARAYLFRADSHDRHVRPSPGSREYAAFCQLMQMNQSYAEQIEAEWAKLGLPTFKEYLRRDLARRMGSQPAQPPATEQPPATPPATAGNRP